MFLCDIRKEFIFIVLHFLTIFPRIICYREHVIILNCCKKNSCHTTRLTEGIFGRVERKSREWSREGIRDWFLGESVGEMKERGGQRGTQKETERGRERKGKAQMVFLVAIAENISSQEPQWLASTDV